MKQVSYIDQRENIQSGDLLVWSTDGSSLISKTLLNIIRFLTSSEYAHVGIAIRIFGRLFVLEATLPVIRLALVSDKEEFYHIPMNVSWSEDCISYLFSKLGLKYSIMDDIRAYFGIVAEADDKYQCAELAVEFYKLFLMDYGNVFTPSKLVKRILEDGLPIFLVKNK